MSAHPAEAILVKHQRYDYGNCLCGWSELGRSHARHQVAMLREAGLLAPTTDGETGQPSCVKCGRPITVESGSTYALGRDAATWAHVHCP